MHSLLKHKWEATQAMTILGVITTLILVTHLTGKPLAPVQPSNIPSDPSSYTGDRVTTDMPHPKAIHPRPSNPREVVVGPGGIDNRYLLLSVDRKHLSSSEDELTVVLRVSSLATEPLVSPFASDMLEICGPGFEPIAPRASFRLPIPAGETLDKHVAFNIPIDLNLQNATLGIHYYNYRKEIPLSLISRTQAE